MKRYTCMMNDGEHCCDFHQLKDARKYRTDDGYWISLTKIEGLVKDSIDYSKEEDFLLTLI